MSGILKSRKKLAALLCLGAGAAALAALGVVLHGGILYYAAVYGLMLAVLALCYAVRRKMQKIAAPFGSFSPVRNVDYLVIGDCIDPAACVPQGATFVQVAAPDRSRNASYQILRHTHSILKEEGGNVVIAIGRGKADFTLFDMPFLHPITVKKYHLEGKQRMSRLAFLFAPIASIRFLVGRPHAFRPAEDVDAQLAAFCQERGYTLTCLERI